MNPRHASAKQPRRGIAARILTFVAGFALAGGAAALAFFVISVINNGSNDAEAQATALVAPTSPTPTVNGSGAITIAWTPSTQPTGVVIQQYEVTRTSGPGSPTTVCTVASSTHSCQDTNLTATTTYGYSVVGILDSWQSPAATASATTATATFSIVLSAGPYTAGTPITVTSITAKVGGVTDTTYSGTKTLTWSGLANSPSSQTPTYPPTSVTFTNGVASPNTTFTAYDAGSNTLTASDAATATGSTTFTLNASTLSSFTVPNPGTQVAGTAISGGETITALDAYGNPASGWTSTTSSCVTFSGPSNSPSNTAPFYPAAGSCGTGNSSLSFNASGHATAAIILYDAQSTSLTVTSVSAVAGKTGSSGSFTVNSATLNSFTVSSPQVAVSSPTSAPTVTSSGCVIGCSTTWHYEVTAVNASGETTPGPSAAVTNASALGGSCNFGFGTCTNAITTPTSLPTGATGFNIYRSSGSGSFGLVASGIAANVKVTDSGLTAGGTPPTTSTATFTGATAGALTNVTVTAVDAFDNPASGWTSVPNCVTFSGPSNSPSPSNTAPTYPGASGCGTGNSSLTFNASGQASASATLFDAQSTSLSVTSVTAPTGKSGSSGSFTVVPGTYNQLLLSTPAPTAGTAFNETVTATDTWSNPVSSEAGSQTTTWSSGSGFPSSSPSGTAPSYPNTLTFNGTSGGVANSQATASITLFDAQSGIALAPTVASKSGTSTTFSVVAGAYSQLLLSTPSPTAGTAFNETLTATDGWQNPVSTESGNQNVTWSSGTGFPASSPGGTAPSYPSTLTFNGTSGGVANSQATTSITLFDAQSGVALAPTVATKSGSSATFTVVAGPYSQLVLPTPSPTAGTAFNETVTATDAWQNPVSTESGTQNVTWASGTGFPATSPGGTAPAYPSTLNFNTTSGGVANSQATASITLYDAQSSVALKATVATKTGTSGTFTVAAGALTFTVSHPSSSTVDVAFNETITATDASGNLVPGWSSATNCVTLSGPANSPSGMSPSYPAAGSCGTGNSSLVFNAAGQATGSVTLFNAQATSITVTSVTAPAGQTGTSATFTPAAGTYSQLVLSTPAPTAGTAFNETVTATDAWQNPVSTESGSHAVTWASGTGFPASSPNPVTAPTYPGTLNFTTTSGGVANSQATASITLFDAQASVALKATVASQSGTSATFGVAAGSPTVFQFTDCIVNSGTSTSPCPSSENVGSNGGDVSFQVAVLDNWGNTAKVTGSQLTVTFSGSSTHFTTPTTATIAVGSSVSGTITVTHTRNNGSDSVSVSTTNSGFTQDSLAVST